MKNVLVTGASTTLGRRLVEHLLDHTDVDRVLGVEPSPASGWVNGAEMLSLGGDHREWVETLCDDAIDTVIHCALAPDRDGSHDTPAEARVVETMRLGAAVSHESVPVRSWVIVSSSAVYPVTSHMPLLQREDAEVGVEAAAEAESLLEAEVYARDVAERTPHLNVAILRLQQLCGPGVRGPLSALLSEPTLPVVIGFDPALQLLAIEDAVRALSFAAQLELAGLYNVASSGVVRLSEAARLRARRTWPVLPFEAGPLAPLAGRLGLPHVPTGMLDVLRFGHAVDTAKLAAAGFHPERDQRDCLAELAS